MIIDQITDIRKQTRLALPDDNMYLYRLGVALYGFASISSFMTEIICHIDQTQNRTDLLSDWPSGKILCLFRDTLGAIKKQNIHSGIYDIMQQTADLFEKLNDQRNDFIHAYPITNKKTAQILHRRKDDKGKYFEVANEFLDQFISQFNAVSDGLYKIREAVRPDL